MIIIKSQDGNSILECKIINMNARNQIIANYVRLIDGEGSVSEEYDLLGEYKTDKKTKEVMEEIEAHINFIEHIKLFGDLQYFRGKIKPAEEGLIYQMPKE